MMAFEIFNVPYEKIELNLMANEHKTPEYLKKNPVHSIRVLEGKTTIEKKLLDDIEQAYGCFEAFLTQRTYLAVDHVTIADVAALVNMTSLEYILSVDEIKFPRVAVWLRNLKKKYCVNQNEAGAAKLDDIIRKGAARSS